MCVGGGGAGAGPKPVFQYNFVRNNSSVNSYVDDIFRVFLFNYKRLQFL